MLTGECKIAFEIWWYEKVESPEFREAGYYYDMNFFHWSMQWGVYLEFFDSVGIYIRCPYKDFSIWKEGMEESFKSEDFDSRPETQAAALNKANEIFNAKQL